MGIFYPKVKAYSRKEINPRLILVSAVLVLLTGCTPIPIDEPPQLDQSQSEPSPSQSEGPNPENETIACDGLTQGEIEEVINSQTKAFSANDYELAYSFASPAFRSNVTLGDFVEIIASSYGPLIESSKLRFSGCLENTNTGLALIDVSFFQSGNSVYGLRYLLTDTQEGWRVQGASDLEVVGEGT